MSSCSFEKYLSKRNGGFAFLQENSQLLLSTATVAECECSRGGALYLNDGCSLTVNSANVLSSSAEIAGGMCLHPDSACMYWSASCQTRGIELLRRNYGSRLPHGAGGIYIAGSVFANVSDLVVANCTTEGSGGGIFLDGECDMSGGVTFQANTASLGAGLYLSTKASLQGCDGCQFLNNTALSSAGGIYVDAVASANISLAHFAYNTAYLYGGAGFVKSGLAVVRTSSFTMNRACSGVSHNAFIAIQV